VHDHVRCEAVLQEAEPTTDIEQLARAQAVDDTSNRRVAYIDVRSAIPMLATQLLDLRGVHAIIMLPPTNLSVVARRRLRVTMELPMPPEAPANVRVPFVELREQHASLAHDLDHAIKTVMDRSWFILGSELAGFEREFAAYCGVSDCIGVASGTEALYLALKAGGIGPGDEVITVSHTFIATALAITWTGATPVFVDIDPETYTMDPDQAAEAISAQTRAILPVHLYGQCADMDPLIALAAKHDLLVVEDACQAHGARYKGRMAGSLGDLGCFSFYPAKNLGACGDAGAVVTGNVELAEKLRRLRNYGEREKYHHQSIGYNSRLDELQAAILRVKLPRLEDWNTARRRVAARYTSALSVKVSTPRVAPEADAAFHLYVIEDEQRDALKRDLEAMGIATQLHYPVPVHLQEAYTTPGSPPTRRLDLRHTERAAERILSLPLWPEISDEAVERVIDAVVALRPGNR
jgi:dTDP-4-amino-4,6-dideoxygalactose transaminase